MNVKLTFLFFSGIDITSEQAAYLSTLFDVGGIAGGILAGLVSDYSGKSASTCAVMLVAAIPLVRIELAISFASETSAT